MEPVFVLMIQPNNPFSYLIPFDPIQGSNPNSLQRKHRVPTPEQLGKSLLAVFIKSSKTFRGKDFRGNCFKERVSLTSDKEERERIRESNTAFSGKMNTHTSNF